MKPYSKIDLYVTCGPGLEKVLEQELIELGFKQVKPGFRGAFVPYQSIRDIYTINYCSRIASRVLLPLLRFRCRNARELYNLAQHIQWDRYLKLDKTFAIDANVTHPELRNSLYAAQVVKDAICDQFVTATEKRPPVDPKNPQIQLNLFIHEELAVISFDTSGTPLHKRGYRLEGGDAPLQETLAAGLYRMAGYKGDEVLCDPCCGSGTLLIEAALIASKTPPGYLRRDWGFMNLPDFATEEWLQVKNQADQERIPLQKGFFFGCDKSKDAVRICKTNLKAAGFAAQVEVSLADFREFTPSKAPNFVMVNPPHGIRLEDVGVLKPLYRALGDFLKRKTAKPAKGFVFTANNELAKEVGLAPKKRHIISSGGVEARLLEFDLFEGPKVQKTDL